MTAELLPGFGALRALDRTAAPGNPSRAELVARDASITGRNVRDVLFHHVFGLFKPAVAAQQPFARRVAGHARDPRVAALDTAVRALGETARRAVALGRIDRLA